MTSTDTHSPALATGRIAAARHLLHRQNLRESVALARQPSLRNAALAGSQAALTLAIALPLVHLSPWPDLIGFAALGALVALFGRFARRAGAAPSCCCAGFCRRWRCWSCRWPAGWVPRKPGSCWC